MDVNCAEIEASAAHVKVGVDAGQKMKDGGTTHGLGINTISTKGAVVHADFQLM